MSRIRVKDLLRVSFRLTLLQSTWCEGGMQSVGLAYCLIPGLKRLRAAPEDVTETLKGLEEPVNTHPFLVGVVAGTVLRVQEDNPDHNGIDVLSRGAMGPLAALGDPFFQSALPAFVAVSAALAAMLGGVLAGILTLLILFNTIHAIVRFGGVFIGYRDGYAVLERVARLLSPARTKLLKTLAAVGAGVVLIAAVTKFGSAVPVWVAMAFGMGGILVALGLVKWQSVQVYVTILLMAVVLSIEVLT